MKKYLAVGFAGLMAISVAACGSSSQPAKKPQANAAKKPNQVVADAKPLPKVNVATCVDGWAKLSQFKNDWNTYYTANPYGGGDTTTLQNDLTGLANDLGTLAGEATNAQDVAHLTADRQAIGSFIVAMQDIGDGDVSDAETYISQGEAGTAGFGTQHLQICGGGIGDVGSTS